MTGVRWTFGSLRVVHRRVSPSCVQVSMTAAAGWGRRDRVLGKAGREESEDLVLCCSAASLVRLEVACNR